MTDYIKSPLNYTGGKYKLLPKILPLFPKEIDRFIDLFCGGCNIAVNVKANIYVCNDIESHVIDFYNNIKILSGEEVDEKIKQIVDKYCLSKTNQQGFLKCREDYNNNQTWDMFYALVAHSFNNQIRYNKKGSFNIPFGKNRSDYNNSLKEKIIEFTNVINENFVFTNNDFRRLNVSDLKSKDFVYADPPYLIATATYNEQDGWNEQDEKDLLDLLDDLDARNIKFALSNVLTHKGKSNDILIEWCKKYNVHHLNHTYSNCNYHSDRGSSDEVLIINY